MVAPMGQNHHKRSCRNQNEEEDAKAGSILRMTPFFVRDRNDSDEGIESQIEIDRDL